ncbi:hypothetical protein BH23GEM9_BH23GEM9_02110 [soil metagenome]
MALRESTAYPESEIEGLIAALHGVMAARVTLSPGGRLEEIHVLADDRMHPKQIVRNIESALSAGLGMDVDRRVISVAQVKPDLEEEPETYPPSEAPAEVEPPPPPARPVQPDSIGRYVFVGYDARTQPDLEAMCRVTIRQNNDVFSGTGNGPSTALGRAQSAARAVFSAIASARQSQSLGLEGVTLVESHGRGYVLVAAHAIIGRSTVPLTGIASLHRSPEEAAILASLQATNRWNEIDG